MCGLINEGGGNSHVESGNFAKGGSESSVSDGMRQVSSELWQRPPGHPKPNIDVDITYNFNVDGDMNINSKVMEETFNPPRRPVQWLKQDESAREGANSALAMAGALDGHAAFKGGDDKKDDAPLDFSVHEKIGGFIGRDTESAAAAESSIDKEAVLEQAQIAQAKVKDIRSA